MIVVAIIGLLASMAIPSFVSAREQSREKSCVNALRQIDGAKAQYALEIGLGDNAPCDMADLTIYLKAVPQCPVNNVDYLVNPISVTPECNSPKAALHNAAYQTP